MDLLLPSKEKSLSHKFYKLALSDGLWYAEMFVILAMIECIVLLYAKGDFKQAKAIEEHLKHCSPTFAKALTLK